MERIDPSGRPLYSPRGRNKKNVKKSGPALSFSELVESEATDESHDVQPAGDTYHASLEKMLDDIHGLGEKIRKDVSFELIAKYRSAVRAFLKTVVTGALQVEAKQSSPNVLRQKKFTLVKVIDGKLERLASGVLMNQHETFEVLAKIDEINGLLIDLIQ
jgi:hypothetical protein